MINVNLKITERALETAIKNSIKKNVESKVIQRAKDSIRDAVRYSANTIMRSEVARYAPDYITEKRSLVMGRDNKSRKVGDLTYSSSFMKEPQFMYLKDAIEAYAKFTMRSTATENLFNLSFELSDASKNKINNAIGFSWMKKVGARNSKSLERRSTLDAGAYQPTWGFLLDLWEYGGSYNVKSRDGGLLSPGPGKDIKSMSVTKTIKPQRMFYLGLNSAKRKILNDIGLTLKKRFKK